VALGLVCPCCMVRASMCDTLAFAARLAGPRWSGRSSDSEQPALCD
jgi:hypothetical protein